MQTSLARDCNWIRTNNHLIHNQTFNYLAKLAKWLNCFVSTCLYGSFDCMCLTCHVRISQWIHTLELPERQGNPGPKLLRNLKLSDCNWNRTHNHLHTYFPVCKCLFKWLWVPLAYFGTSNLRITSSSH